MASRPRRSAACLGRSVHQGGRGRSDSCCATEWDLPAKEGRVCVAAAFRGGWMRIAASGAGPNELLVCRREARRLPQCGGEDQLWLSSSRVCIVVKVSTRRCCVVERLASSDGGHPKPTRWGGRWASLRAVGRALTIVAVGCTVGSAYDLVTRTRHLSSCRNSLKCSRQASGQVVRSDTRVLARAFACPSAPPSRHLLPGLGLASRRTNQYA